MAGLIIYFLISTILRVLSASGLEDDESEQMLAAQSLSWGYGPQPPLFTWIQFGLQTIFGPSVLAIAVQKNLILFGIIFCTYRIARKMSGSHATGMLAGVLVVFSVELIWESQRDRTHNVLATFFAVAALLQCARIVSSRTARNYLLLGVLLGAGVLAKYNFVVMVLSLFIAMLMVPDYRRCVLNSRVALTAVSSLVVVAPHIAWVVRNPEISFRAKGKLYEGMIEGESTLGWIIEIPIHLIEKWLAIVGPVLGLAMVFWFVVRKRSIRELPEAHRSNRQFLMIQMVAALTIVLIGMWCMQVTSLKSRWFLPISVGLPIWLALTFAGAMTEREWLGIQFVGAATAFLILFALPVRHVLLGAAGKTSRSAMPHAELAASLKKTYPNLRMVIAEDDWLGGNLRLSLPEVLFVSPETPTIARDRIRGTIAAVWNAERGPELPSALGELRGLALTVASEGQRAVSEGIYQYTKSTAFRMASSEVVLQEGKHLSQSNGLNGHPYFP